MAEYLAGLEDADGNPIDVSKWKPINKNFETERGQNFKPAPSVLDTVGAYYRQHNWLGSVAADKVRGSNNRFDGTWDFDTELSKNPDLVNHKDKLFAANNKERFESIAAQIRMERGDQDTIARSDGFWPNAVGIVASALDPSLLVPGTVVVKGAKTASTVAKTVAASAAIGTATGFVQGSVIDATQVTDEDHAARDYALFGTVGGTLFGGAVGSKVAKQMSANAKQQLVQHVAQQVQTSGNAGAMKVAQQVMDDGERIPVLEGYIKARKKALPLSTPNMELATSESVTTRQVAQHLGNNAIETKKNAQGFASPQSVELGQKQHATKLEGELVSKSIDAYSGFKSGWEKINFSAMSDELKLIGKNVSADELKAAGPSKQLFHELIAVANRNGDTSAIKEVEQIAQATTRRIYTELGDRANAEGLFNKIHDEAERNAYKNAIQRAPARTTLDNMTNLHNSSVMDKQVAQLLRLKDRLFAMKQAGQEASAQGQRTAKLISDFEAKISQKNGGQEALKKVHDEFASRLKAITSDVNDLAARRTVSKAMFDERKLSSADAALSKKAAKENLENFAKQQAAIARAESEALIPKTAKSYLPRMWDREKILADERGFKGTIINHIVNNGTDAGEAKLIADDLFNQMGYKADGVTGHSPALASTSFGSLKARSIDIPDNVIGQFLINDHEIVTKAYIRDMTRALEFNRVFNGKKINEILDDIVKDYDKLREAVFAKGLPAKKEAAELKKLHKSYLKDEANIKFLYNKIMGHGSDAEEWALFTSATNGIKKLTNVALLVNVTATSLGDFGRLVSVNGFGRPLRSLISSMSPTFRNLTKAEAEEIGHGFERVLSTRINDLSNIDSNILELRKGVLGKGIDRLSAVAGELNLFNRWNSMGKHLAGVLHTDKVLNAALDYSKLGEEEIVYLAKAGLDKDMAMRINEQFTKYGVNEGGFKFAQSVLWDDTVAKEVYERAIFKLVNHTIMTPDMGGVPTYFKSKVGSVVFQLMSFATAAEEQMLIAGMQRHSANEVKGLLTMFGLTAVGIAIKDLINGKDPADRDPAEAAWKVLNAVGVFGPVGFVNDKMHQLGMGVEDIVSDNEFRPAGLDNVLGLVVGPGINTYGSAVKGMSNIIRGVDSKKDYDDIQKAIPLANTLFLHLLANQYDASLYSTFGE